MTIYILQYIVSSDVNSLVSSKQFYVSEAMYTTPLNDDITTSTELLSNHVMYPVVNIKEWRDELDKGNAPKMQ